MKTASWFTKLLPDQQMIGISRSAPRKIGPGYRLFKKLAPGGWFNSVSPEEYYRRYREEILAPLDPHAVAAELDAMGGGRTPVLVCFEKPNGTSWCHRAMAAEWLAEALGRTVPEIGFDDLPQHEHPLMPVQLRRPVVFAGAATVEDVTPYIGRHAMIEGVEHRIVGADVEQPGRVLMVAQGRQFSTSFANVRRLFT